MFHCCKLTCMLRFPSKRLERLGMDYDPSITLWERPIRKVQQAVDDTAASPAKKENSPRIDFG